MRYAVLISAGTPIDYSRKVGWDHPHDSRAEAEALADRARRNPGWSAKVITLTEAEALHWHESVNERLDRERAEFEQALREGTLYR